MVPPPSNVNCDYRLFSGSRLAFGGPASRKKYRYWIATLPFSPQSYPDWAPQAPLPPEVSYMLGQQEIGGSGYHHWQFIIYCREPVRVTQLKKRFPIEIHLEPSKSCCVEDYVTKEDTGIAGSKFELGIVYLIF